MLLAMQFGNGFGAQPQAWRAPGVDPHGFADFDTIVGHAQNAERAGFDFLFVPDFFGLDVDISTQPSMVTLEPLTTLAAVARGTQRIGMVSTASTTFNEPYNIARMFKTLDVMSHGRMGWNAVPTADPVGAANFGAAPLPTQEKYERLHETVQIVQALWGSWGRDAFAGDQAAGRFADAAQIQPVNLQGRHVASRGPLPVPPSEQGQPVIFQAGGGDNGREVAGRYANGVIGATYTIEDAVAQRTALREAAERNGRDPDEIKFFPGVMPAFGSSVRDAIDRRLELGRDVLPTRVGYLGQMLGLRLGAGDLDRALTSKELDAARPSPMDPRSQHALAVAREGWTVREVLAHGVIDYHPTPVGPASVTADHVQEWFKAGAADGFWFSFDVYERDIDTFADEVRPLLLERGLIDPEYRGATLREHLGVPYQYGPDPRIA